MIVFEDGIRDLVNQLPTINGFKPHFSWGNELALNQYLKVQTESPYPLIWLIAGKEVEDDKSNEIDRNCRFILSCEELTTTKLNPDRLEDNFKDVLIPLKDNFIKGLTRFSITTMPDRKRTIEKIPNMFNYETGTRINEKNPTVTKWDAITIDVRIVMRTDKCQNTIKWQ